MLWTELLQRLMVASILLCLEERMEERRGEERREEKGREVREKKRGQERTGEREEGRRRREEKEGGLSYVYIAASSDTHSFST